MASDGLGFFDAAPASSSSEEDEEDEEAAPAAEPAAPAPEPAPAPAAPAAPPAAPEGDAAGAKRKRAGGLLSPEEAAALVGGTASYRFTGPDADPAEEAGFYSGGATAEAAAKASAAAHIGLEGSRTVEVPDSTVGFLLAGGGKQIKALEDATGCRVVVDREGRGRDAAQRAAAADAQVVRKVTLIGDDTALREGERRLQEMVLSSGKHIQRTIRCTANQAGALIGRGGAMVKRLQSATNTLINVSGRDAAASGDADAPRTVSITGAAWNVDLASRFVFAAMRDPAELSALIADAEAAQAAGAGGGAKASHASSGYGDAAAFAAVYGGK